MSFSSMMITGEPIGSAAIWFVALTVLLYIARTPAHHAITSFSRVPLQVLSGGGVAIACLALIYGGWMVLRTLIFVIDLPGYASLMTAVLFLGGVQLIGLGVLGEYLGRVFEEVKGRPSYLVRDRWSQNR